MIDKKMIILLSIFILSIIAISSVNATDNNDTHIQKQSTTIQYDNIHTDNINNQEKKTLKKEESKTIIENYDQLYEKLNSNEKKELDITLEGDATYIIDKQINVNERIKNININGNNKTFKSLNTSFMKIGSNTNITISNIIVEGCNSTTGSVFNNRGNLTIINSSFINNTAQAEGGVIYNSKNLDVKKCTFINNSALKGGVINSHKQLTLRDSIFENNSAKNGGVFYIYGTTNTNITNNTIDYSNASFGGVIFCYGMGNLTVTDNHINHTHAGTHGGVILNHGLENVILEGNVIENTISQWGSICINMNRMTLKNNTFNKNRADFGGVLFNWGDMNIEDNIFTYNKAELGGCIYNCAESTLNMIRNEFKGNHAEDGGVLYNSGTCIIDENTFISNYATVSKGYVIKSDEDLINEDSEHVLYLTNNLFINNTDYIRDMLLSYDRIDAIYNNTYIGNYLKTNISNVNDTDAVDKIEKNITVTVDEKYNTTINDGYIKKNINDNYIKDVNVEDNNTIISLNSKKLETYNKIDLTYTSDDYSFQESKTTFNAYVYKNTRANITTNNPEYNNILTINTKVTDLEGKSVTKGYAIYKINNLTLKKDNQTIKTMINNSTTTLNYQLPENWKPKEYLLEVIYSQNKDYNHTRTTIRFNITKAKKTITVNTDKNSSKMDENITITAKIKSTKNINNGVMLFKINGITIKDEYNQTIQIPVINNTAEISFTIPDGCSAKKTKITAVYVNKNYERMENNTYFNITATKTTFKIIYSNMTENTLNITTVLTDEHNHRLKGLNTIIVKINSLTIKDNNNKTCYFNTRQGLVNINVKLNKTLKKGNYTIEIVTGKRNAYTAARKQLKLSV